MSYIAAMGVLVVLVVFAFNNRFLGRELYGPRLGYLAAHWVGVAIQVAFTGMVTYLWLAWLKGEHWQVNLWAVGIAWAVLAEAAEMVIFLGPRHRTLAHVLSEYNPLRGRGWWLVPLAYLLAPVLVRAWFFA
jgi:hypothetical protein